MDKEKGLRIKGKLNFYMDKKIKVHISRVDGSFWNGFIVDRPTDDVYDFEEDKIGKCHLFVLDVYKIEEFKVSSGNGGVRKC